MRIIKIIKILCFYPPRTHLFLLTNSVQRELVLICTQIIRNCNFPCSKFKQCKQCPCLLAMSMFISNVYVYWQCLCLLAMFMFIGNVHVYWQCPCLLAMFMFIGNVHVYWQCLCLLPMSMFISNVHVY